MRYKREEDRKWQKLRLFTYVKSVGTSRVNGWVNAQSVVIGIVS